MEAAIRSALTRAGSPDANQRARIYHSAREALARSLARQGISDAATSQVQKDRLDQLIAKLENEWTTGSAPADPLRSEPEMPAPPVRTAPGPGSDRDRPAASPEASPSGAAPVSGRREPEFTADPDFDRAHPDGAPSPSAPVAPTRDDRLTIPPPRREPPPGSRKERSAADKAGAGKARRRRRPGLSALFSGVVLLAFLGLGLWFLGKTGILQSTAEFDTSAPDSPVRIAEGGDDSSPRLLDPGAGFSDAWTTIYLAGEGGEATIRGQATAEIVDTGEGRALRITSGAAGEAGEVLVPVSASALEQLAGRRSVLALTLQSPDNESSQIYIECAFSSLGGCGRLRFNVGYALTDLLFEVDYDGEPAPGEGGHLIVNSDVTGSGDSIDLYAIRIRAAD